MARFIKEREHTPGEEQVVRGVSGEHLDLEVLNRALRSEDRPEADASSALRALADLGVADPGAVSPPIFAAAVALFAKQPRNWLRGAAVQVVRRVGVGPGPGPTSARKEFEGPIEVVAERTLDFIREHTTSHQAVTGRRREVLPEYPETALREALLNALAHRDYHLVNTTVDVTLWHDRLEIRSPGSFPGHITLQNIRDEHCSRNPRIMRVLKMLNLVEEYGEGVDRMFHEMEVRLMEPPLFDDSGSSITVTFKNQALVSVEDQVWLSLLGKFDLSPEERRLLVLAKREGQVTPRRLRELLGEEDASGLLQRSMAKGLVTRVGRSGGSRYILSEEIALRAGTSGVEARSRKRQTLLDEIRRRGSLSTAEAIALVDEPARIVRDLLNDLASSGSVEARGNTRARRYYPA